MKENRNRSFFWGFIARFTIAHVVTYVVLGIIFFNLKRYNEHFTSPELATIMRSTDSPWVMAGPLFQFIRGPLLALALYPFRKIIIEGRWGWLKLWGVLWVLTGIGAVTAGVGSIEGIVYTKLPLNYHFIGLPEVTLQMLVFSWVLFIWERRVDSKLSKQNYNINF